MIQQLTKEQLNAERQKLIIGRVAWFVSGFPGCTTQDIINAIAIAEFAFFNKASLAVAIHSGCRYARLQIAQRQKQTEALAISHFHVKNKRIAQSLSIH